MRLIQLTAFMVVTGAVLFAHQQDASSKCVISFHARIFVQWGPDAIPPNRKFNIPISQTRFYLMDADPALLLKEAALPYPEFQSYDGTTERRPAGIGIYLAALEIKEEGGFYGGNSHLRDFYEKASKIIDPHILQRVVTDKEGKAAFAGVAPGTYFVVGSSASSRAEAWNLKVEARAERVHVILDEKNKL